MSFADTLRTRATAERAAAQAALTAADDLGSAAEAIDAAAAVLESSRQRIDALTAERDAALAEVARLKALIAAGPVEPPPVDPPPPPPVEPPPPPPPPVDPPPPPPPPVDPPPVEPPPAEPPPVAGSAGIVVFDGSMGTSLEGAYGNLVPWREKGGDWIDAAGIRQGSTPFASTTARPGDALVSLDVSPMVRPGQALQVVLRASGNTLQAKSRETGDGARVVYSLLDGSIVTHSALADVEVNATTVAQLGKATTLTMYAKSTVYLRFPEPPPGALGATLQLATVKVWGTLTVAAFGVVAPFLQRDDSRVTLDGDPRVFFRSEAFEEPLFAGLFDERYANRAKIARVIDTPAGRALEMTFDPSQQGLLNLAVPFVPEATEAAFEYDLTVLSSFFTSDGGKMPGFSSRTKPDDAYGISQLPPEWRGIPPGSMGTLIAGNGGRRVNGHDGWSLRGGHGVRLVPGHPLGDSLMLDTYAYTADMPGLYGESWVWTQYGPDGCLQIGRKHRVYQRLRVNTPGVRDGVLEVRIDGKLVYLKTNVYLRDGQPWAELAALGVQTDGAIGRVWLNMFHGGKKFPPVRAAAFVIRNFKAARFDGITQTWGRPQPDKSIDNW